VLDDGNYLRPPYYVFQAAIFLVHLVLAGCRKTTCVAIAALKFGSNRSFIHYKLPHFAKFYLALAASQTFFNSLLESR